MAKSFSERYGYTSKPSTLQVEDLSDDLRVGLWNALTIYYWHDIDRSQYVDRLEIGDLALLIWIAHFKKPVDEIPKFWGDLFETIKTHFFECSWYEVLDLIQFVVGGDRDKSRSGGFAKACNLAFESEVSGYRFIGEEIAPITSASEKSAIEDALRGGGKLAVVSAHLSTALEHLSRKQSPDFRNSIKESISAVESLASLICGKKATLTDALKRFEGNVAMHPALRQGLEKIYAYTSDAHGIRHAMMDDDTLGLEDAKFMLVSCSAFVNYLVEKAGKAGIQLK